MSDDKKRNKNKKDNPPITPVISARITPYMFGAIEEIVDAGFYLRVSDYLRDLIRKDLQSRGIKIE